MFEKNKIILITSTMSFSVKQPLRFLYTLIRTQNKNNEFPGFTSHILQRNKKIGQRMVSLISIDSMRSSLFSEYGMDQMLCHHGMEETLQRRARKGVSPSYNQSSHIVFPPHRLRLLHTCHLSYLHGVIKNWKGSLSYLSPSLR